MSGTCSEHSTFAGNIGANKALIKQCLSNDKEVFNQIGVVKDSIRDMHTETATGIAEIRGLIENGHLAAKNEQLELETKRQKNRFKNALRVIGILATGGGGAKAIEQIIKAWG